MKIILKPLFWLSFEVKYLFVHFETKEKGIRSRCYNNIVTVLCWGCSIVKHVSFEEGTFAKQRNRVLSSLLLFTIMFYYWESIDTVKTVTQRQLECDDDNIDIKHDSMSRVNRIISNIFSNPSTLAHNFKLYFILKLKKLLASLAIWSKAWSSADDLTATLLLPPTPSMLEKMIQHLHQEQITILKFGSKLVRVWVKCG